MGDFKMGSKTVMSQSGTSNPTFGTGAPTGAIINVLSTTITTALDLGSVASGGEVQVTGLTVAITPKTTSSKMLLMYNVMASKTAHGGMSILILKRDSTAIGVATGLNTNQLAATNAFDQYSNTSAEQDQNTTVASGTFLDSPSTTSEITYKVFLGNTSSSSRTIYVNRGLVNSTNVYNSRGTSTLTVMEVAG